MASGTDRLQVEIVYALAERQWRVPIEVPPGTTARAAARAAREQLPDVDVEHCPLGIYGRKVADDQALAEGDRVELYRPLKADPKEARRKRAAVGRAVRRRRM